MKLAYKPTYLNNNGKKSYSLLRAFTGYQAKLQQTLPVPKTHGTCPQELAAAVTSDNHRKQSFLTVASCPWWAVLGPPVPRLRVLFPSLSLVLSLRAHVLLLWLFFPLLTKFLITHPFADFWNGLCLSVCLFL